MSWASTLVLAFLFLFYLFTPVDSAARDAANWSDTTPSINLTHIFSGDINRKGKATGFHHRPDSKDLPGAKIKTLLSGPNKAGIYTAIVEILDPKTGKWKEKFSSMFPDRLKQKQLITAIIRAFKKNTQRGSGKWRGSSDYGFPIEGYTLKDGRIITAYPIFQTDE